MSREQEFWRWIMISYSLGIRGHTDDSYNQEHK